ncbi:hypothetical protein Dcar01_02399 [Deinococcus carri]|uniref:Uncharacterized protein n=1 Tax=Deinococcus carri TaxID=1211323 RepID=A0ABP9WA70_9DEIO
MREALEGMYLPRSDLTGWRVDIGDQVFTQQDPGPIQQIDIELDSIGCLTGGTLALKSPRHPLFPPFTVAARVWVASRTRGLVPVAVGFVPGPREDGREEYTLELRPMEQISLKDYFDGTFAGATGAVAQPSGWLQKNEEVVQEALKGRPKASIGVAHDGRVYLAEPGDGQPVRVPRQQFYEWKSTGYVDVPYATRSRWDGGPGWRKGEYVGIARPPYAERRAVDAGEVQFVEVTRDAGPPVITVAELTVNAASDEDLAAAGLDGTGKTPVVGIAPPSQVVKKTVVAEQYALVHVYDLGAWYEGSALPGQDNELVKKLQDAVNAAQAAFLTAHDVLGPDNAFTREEQDQLDYARNQLRLGKLGANDHQSDYEPLTAKLSTGFVLDALLWQPLAGGEDPSDPPPQDD